jgi:hypothetical protein
VTRRACGLLRVVNAEQAPKRVMWKPTRTFEAGKAGVAGGVSETCTRSSTGVLAVARMHREIDATREAPRGGRAACLANRTPARDRPGRSGWPRGSYDQ